MLSSAVTINDSPITMSLRFHYRCYSLEWDNCLDACQIKSPGARASRSRVAFVHWRTGIKKPELFQRCRRNRKSFRSQQCHKETFVSKSEPGTDKSPKKLGTDICTNASDLSRSEFIFFAAIEFWYICHSCNHDFLIKDLLILNDWT